MLLLSHWNLVLSRLLLLSIDWKRDLELVLLLELLNGPVDLLLLGK